MAGFDAVKTVRWRCGVMLSEAGVTLECGHRESASLDRRAQDARAAARRAELEGRGRAEKGERERDGELHRQGGVEREYPACHEEGASTKEG